MRFLVYSILFLVLLVVGCGSGKEKEKTEAVDSTLSKLNSPELKAVNTELRADPNNAALYYKRGQLYFKNKDLDAARDDANRAVKLDSLKPEYFMLLSDVYFASNQTRFSKDALERCVKANPGSIEANLKLAELYFYVKKYQESIHYIDNVLKINENTAKGYFLKGMNFKEMGDTTLAISSFQTTVEQDNEYLDAYLELGTLLTIKKNALALEYLKTALKMQPGNNEVMYEIGMYYQQTKNYPAAMDTYKTILTKDPKYKKAYYNMGAIELYANKNYTQAIKHFTNAINADPNYADAYFARGVCYEELKDKTNAMADYQMALQIDPQHAFAIENLNALEKK
jgi:tetratricopeptide (TPR) repeat protein